jgi:DNA-directed RNA polymerase specialized sigma24 family protein
MKTVDDRDTGQPGAEAAVAGLFAARYPELVRLAGLLGADDPEDIAQEAFARLLRCYIRWSSATPPGRRSVR